jgi:hypothetical protein
MNALINVRELSHDEVDAVAGGWFSHGVYETADGKNMHVWNWHLGGGKILIHSWVEGEKQINKGIYDLS